MDNQGDKEYGRNSIEELLAMPLVIPPYQRPYKWGKAKKSSDLEKMYMNR